MHDPGLDAKLNPGIGGGGEVGWKDNMGQLTKST